MQDIIGFVKVHANRKREDLAGEVLALLLREEPGQAVIRELVTSCTSPVDVEIVTRRASDGCVPDIHLIQEARTIALLELKFWASLTPHQLSGKYFDVATHVTFVVPEKRVSSVRNELSSLAANHFLAVVSWEHLLGRLESASSEATTREQKLFKGALEHLKEYCDVIEKAHFTPFTPEELCSPHQDTSAQHLVWLTKNAIDEATKFGIIAGSGRLGAGFDDWFFYGQNVLLNGFRVWLGYWPHAWKLSPSSGPVWVQFYAKDASKLIQSGAFTDGVRIGNEIVFPLLKTSGVAAVSQEDEVAGVIASIAALNNRLIAVASPAESSEAQ